VIEPIRRLEPTDAVALTEFFTVIAADPATTRHFHPHAMDRGTAERIASGSGRDVYLGCFRGLQVVGYAMLRGWDEGYERPSFGVAVDPGQRSRGIGSRLLDEALRIARTRGCKTVMLKVHRENAGALAWYRSAGFFQIGETADGQLICELNLASAATSP
jgi:ribosomal protein S18 acetylase RimI-like enzyme